jgi:hypothetical protein
VRGKVCSAVAASYDHDLVCGHRDVAAGATWCLDSPATSGSSLEHQNAFAIDNEGDVRTWQQAGSFAYLAWDRYLTL